MSQTSNHAPDAPPALFLGLHASPSVLRTLKWVALYSAVLAVAFSFFGRELQLLQFRPGGSTFDTAVRPIFLGMFVVGVVVALRWELIGGIIAVFAAAGSVAFATNLLITPHALLTVASFAIPGALWVAIDLFVLSARKAAIGLAAAVVMAVGGYRAGVYAHERVWGPTHPDTTVTAPEPSMTEWIWAGSTTTTTTEVRAKFSVDFSENRLAVSAEPDLSDPQWFDGEQQDLRIVSYTVDGLEPGTTYHYAPEVDGEVDLMRAGRFETFPEGPASFQVAFGACARVGSNGRVFDAIDELDPLLYAVVGDFHYGDNDVDSLERYHDVLDLTLTQPAQAALYRSTSMAYVWDDHDYGANDSDSESVARTAAMASYRQYVPSYELAGPFSAVYQSFTIGRVRFLMTDARAARDVSSALDDADKTMLGEEQKEWLKEELLLSSQSHELVVWVNPVPWVAETDEGGDNWGGYDTERRELANHIVDNDIDNLVMVSGDAHMVAIDDGTNTNFSDQAGPAFPLLHVAALDRTGSVKGGPYSEGAIAGGGQFATLTVDDGGGPLEVVLQAHDWQGETLLEHRFTVSG